MENPPENPRRQVLRFPIEPEKPSKTLPLTRLTPAAVAPAPALELLTPNVLRPLSRTDYAKYYYLDREEAGIASLESLRQHLQVALKLELTTIPLYLCALYSMEKGSNNLPRRIVRSVMLEEMLHMILVANVLNAVGGEPKLHGKLEGKFKHMDAVPSYPAGLPASKSEQKFRVSLQKFSNDALDDFMKIEQPASPEAPPEGVCYDTIGQFYAAIRLGLRDHGKFDGNDRRGRQVGPEQYYGAGGNLVRITNLETAERALDEIVGQGEGVEHMLTSGDASIFDVGEEYAHYFRFNELRRQQLYAPGDTPQSGPSGERIAIDWSTIYPMKTNPPRIKDYPRGSELHAKALEFNRVYTRLLMELETSFLGQPGHMLNAVGLMYELRYKAVDLMRIPLPESKKGHEVTAGPSFEFIPEAL